MATRHQEAILDVLDASNEPDEYVAEETLYLAF